MSKNVREVALDVLLKIEKKQAYSNLLLNDTIKKSKLSDRDTALLTEIIYGTIQRRDTIDFYLQPYTKKAKKMQDWVKVLLRLSIYQIVYLDKIPERAVVHEAVQIAKIRGHQGISGFVNGVLRNFLRNPLRSFSEIRDPVERLAVETSHPLWLVKRWINVYGAQETEKMCQTNLLAPQVTVRVNKLKGSVEQIKNKLEEEGISVRRGNLAEDSFIVEKGNVLHTNCFKNGEVTIQDESSMLVARALAPEENSVVLDACAAPGGKTTHLAERMNNKGKIIACDLHEHKVKLIQNATNRLGISIIEANVLDARKASTTYREESFDYILVDAPCSGFGVVRRKPDLKWTKKEEDIFAIANIQQEILHAVSPLLKRGGRLVYSTCTIDPEENEQIVDQFVRDHSQFEFDESLVNRLPEKLKVSKRLKTGQVTILPHDFDTDGFFIAAMIKKA